jgi:GNAT superfamily N-acetyltransferase
MTHQPQGQEWHEVETVLRRLNRWQAEKQRDLSVECCGLQAGEEFHHREQFKHRLVADSRHPGFDMLIAETTQTLVGFVFGVPVDRDGSWWQGFVGVLPPYIEQLTASGHVFAITDLVVHPYLRHHGVARRLQERLLGDHQASLGVALVDQADRVAHAAVLSWGWQEVGELCRTPEQARYRVVTLPVGERTAAVPGGLVHNSRTQRPPVT